jgi:5-methylcytosine-specific restriction endonuclease McrA
MSNAKMGSENRRRRKARLFELSGGKCFWCRVPLTYEDATIDHVVARGRGGSNALENLVLACEPCNQTRGCSKVSAAFVSRRKDLTYKREAGIA